MRPFISPASKEPGKCSGCGGNRYEKKRTREFENEIPICVSCGGHPKLFRVIYSVPIIDDDGFKKVERIKDFKDRRLSSASRADAFCSELIYFIEKDEAFDPRELGSEKEREAFLIKSCSDKYLSHHKASPTLTPAGYAKKERIVRLYIKPIFGDLTPRDMKFKTIKKRIDQKYLTPSVRNELLKELSPFLKWASTEGMIVGVPELPKKTKGKTFKASDFYNLKERNLVIGNIKKRSSKIAIMILANYTRRKSEVICLRWGDVNFKKREITFSRHISDGKGKTPSKELDGLKSSPESSLKYDFFPGLYEMLMELTPSLNPKELIFKNKKGDYLGKNVLYESWKRSAMDLIERDELKRFVDLHRGTRNSTLSALYQNGMAESILVELYGGDLKTMKEHYAKKDKQNLGKDWNTSEHLIQ